MTNAADLFNGAEALTLSEEDWEDGLASLLPTSNEMHEQDRGFSAAACHSYPRVPNPLAHYMHDQGSTMASNNDASRSQPTDGSGPLPWLSFQGYVAVSSDSSQSVMSDETGSNGTMALAASPQRFPDLANHIETNEKRKRKRKAEDSSSIVSNSSDEDIRKSLLYRERNRLHARKSRERKRLQLVELQGQIDRLEKENGKLKTLLIRFIGEDEAREALNEANAK